MGEKLIRIYEIVTEKIGLQGRLEFARRTGISMNEAARIADTEELVQRFKQEAGYIYDKMIKNGRT